MITEYHRPETLEIALELLRRKHPRSIPLAGGGCASLQGEEVAVVDLQALGLEYLHTKGNIFCAGAMATLQVLSQENGVYEDLKLAIRQESPSLNSRNTSTIAGALMVSGGNSPLATSLIALDSETLWLPEKNRISVSNWLSLRPKLPGLLIEAFEWTAKTIFKYAGIGRSPADKPFLCVAINRWPSGRARIALGMDAFKTPTLVLDGPDFGGYDHAIINACSQLNNHYLTQTAITLTKRLIHKCGDSNE